jgi:hypothetical protein
VVGNEVFYTELTDLFGPTDAIRVAPFNGGAGGADTRTLPNPRPDTGVQDLAFAGGVLYALTGYDESAPQVFGLNPTTGAVVSGPVSLSAPAADDSDGFVVLPSGKFLVNSGDADCTYSEFDPVTGIATGSSFTVPGASSCTGVDTDGTNLYFATDFSTLTKTTLAGALISSVAVGSNMAEDISVIPSTGQLLSPAHVWVGLKNSDDQGTQFDVKVEMLKNGTPVASGLTRCVTGITRNPALAKEVVVNWDGSPSVSTTAGDVLSLRVSTRIGTNGDDTKCPGPGGSHNNAIGLRLYYDATSRPSRFDLASADQFLHSDGNACVNAESTGVTTRFFNSTAPSASNAKCKDSAAVNFAGGNLYKEIGTWSKTV